MIFPLKALLPPALRSQLRQVAWALGRLPDWRRTLGWSGAFRLASAEPFAVWRGRRAAPAAYGLALPGVQMVQLRPNSSDFEAFVHVFVDRAFDDLPLSGPVEYILDLGANVGFASLDLLRRFPGARLAAIEPDPANFAMLRTNLQAEAERVTLIQAGVWSEDGWAVKDETPWRDGREWSVRLKRTDAPGGVALLSIPTLLDRLGWDRVDFVKMDIEGAEREVMGVKSERWLSRVGVIAAELHDHECEEAFHAAIGPVALRSFRLGELTVAVLDADSALTSDSAT